MKKLFCIFVAIVILFSVVGCASAPSAEMASGQMVSTMSNPEMAADMVENSSVAKQGDAANSEKIGEVVLGERKLIREANLGLEVEDVQSTLNRTTGLSVQMAGW